MVHSLFKKYFGDDEIFPCFEHFIHDSIFDSKIEITFWNRYNEILLGNLVLNINDVFSGKIIDCVDVYVYNSYDNEYLNILIQKRVNYFKELFTYYLRSDDKNWYFEGNTGVFIKFDNSYNNDVSNWVFECACRGILFSSLNYTEHVNLIWSIKKFEVLRYAPEEFRCYFPKHILDDADNGVFDE